MEVTNSAPEGRDVLTGTWKREWLHWNLSRELIRLAQSTAEFKECFLCCDIDNFSAYVDRHGFHESDNALLELAERLHDASNEVYRVGSDEFVVRGLGSPLPDALEHRGISVRQTVVNVRLPIDAKRINRCTSWIVGHLHFALIQPNLTGTLDCRAPSEWTTRT
jgi:diguanylate cyclase (GGDEF)-like protein